LRAAERQAARRQVYSLVTISMIVVFGIVAIFMLLGATRRKASKIFQDPITALREVFARQETLYRLKNGRYASFEELVKAGVLDEEILKGPIQGYLYKDAVITKDRFEITAEPSGPAPLVSEPVPGQPPPRAIARRYYMVDDTHTIRSDSAPVTSMSPVVWSPRDWGPR
jgi:competence protein ComGC